MMRAVEILAWERDLGVADGVTNTWTSMFIVGDSPEDGYDMLIIGEPGRVGPTPYSVTGTRGMNGVTFAEGTASSWNEACRLVVIEARRASIRPVE